jgi:methylamine dehydrogenase accessory protein MauD
MILGYITMNAFLLLCNLSLWAVVLFLGFLLLGALRALGLLRWRLEQLEATTPSRLGRSGLKPGKKAPPFTLPEVAGGETSLHDFAGRKTLLVFMQPGCGPCHGITPELNRLQDGGDVQVVVVQNTDVETARRWAKEHRPRFPVAVQERLSLSKRYEVFATPFAFLIDEKGVVRSKGLVGSKQHLGFVLSGRGVETHDQVETESNSPERGELQVSVVSSTREVSDD